MAQLKCLACGHANKPGDEACASCATSLNILLCSECEAVNAASAEKCYACGTALSAPAKPTMEAPEPVLEIERPARSLPTTSTTFVQEQPRSILRRVGSLLALPVVFVAGAAAYHFVYQPGGSPTAGPTQVRAPLPKAAPAPASAPATQAPVAQAGSVANPAPTTGVTHTRTTTAAEPAKKAAAPVVRSAPPAAAAAVATPAVAAPEVSEPVYSRVTHTKGAAEAPAAPSQPPIQKEPSAACPPGVAALGLCKP